MTKITFISSNVKHHYTRKRGEQRSAEGLTMGVL